MSDVYSLKGLLEKKLNRKQFLQHLAMACLSLMGINSMITAFSKPQQARGFGTSPVNARRFGSSKYGK